MATSSGVFHPEGGITAMYFSACVIGVGCGVVLIYAAWGLGSVWLAVLALGQSPSVHWRLRAA
jgi:hypothetical protein